MQRINPIVPRHVGRGPMQAGFGGIKPPVRQADAFLSQANPVSGTKYEVLATTSDVRVYQIMAKVTWTVQPTPLEVHVTIDGNSIVHSKANPVSATAYYAQIYSEAAEASQPLDATDYALWHRGALYEGRSVKIEAEVTGGTSNPLVCRAKYAKY